MEQKNNRTAYMYASFTIFLWASSFPGIKYALNFYSPEKLMLLRFLVASATLVIIAIIHKARMPARQDIPIAAAGGAIGIFLYMWLFNTGTGMVKSGISSFIIATAPVFTLLFSSALLKEAPSMETILGFAVSLFGLILIAIGQIQEFSLNIGLLMLLCAAVLTSLYNIIQRRISYKYTPIECTSYSIVFATALMLVFSPGAIEEIRAASFTANALIVYLGVFPAALAYLSWNYAIGKAEKVTNVTNFMYLTPFLATALSFVFLGEVLSAISFAGGVIIIAGMVLSNRRPKKQEKPKEAV